MLEYIEPITNFAKKQQRVQNLRNKTVIYCWYTTVDMQNDIYVYIYIYIYIYITYWKQLMMHSVHWYVNPPPQNPHLLFVAKPLNLQAVEAPFLGNITPPLYIAFSRNVPKNRIFLWTPILLKFFTLNTISFSKSN